MGQTQGFFKEIMKLAVLLTAAFLIVVPIRLFVFQPFLVRGDSMEPNFSDGDYLIVDELTFRFRDPERGEVVVFRFPHNPDQRYIKRVIGLPGETVEIQDGKVVLYDESEAVVLEESYLPEAIRTPGIVKIGLREGEYFVLGDNRPFSSDSRQWGVLPEENIIGKALFRAFPLTAIAAFHLPEYE